MALPSDAEYAQDGPEAQRIASVIPYYPFHGEFFLLFILCEIDFMGHFYFNRGATFLRH